MKKLAIVIISIFICNMLFAKGAIELYTDAHSEEWIKEAILAHPNVKEIAKMIKVSDSPRYLIYMVMKDETKIILSGVKAYDKDLITCTLSRLGDYTDPRMLAYNTTYEEYYCGNISAGYDNKKFQEYMDLKDINIVLDNYKEFEEFFSSMPCLTKEDINLLKERREKEIKVLQNIDWERVKKHYSYYVVLKADDVGWGQWKVE